MKSKHTYKSKTMPGQDNLAYKQDKLEQNKVNLWEGSMDQDQIRETNATSEIESEDGIDDEGSENNIFQKNLKNFENFSSKITKSIYKRKSILKNIFCLLATIGWVVYLAFAISKNYSKTIPLIVVTAISVFFKSWSILVKISRNHCHNCGGFLKKIEKFSEKYEKFLNSAFILLGLAAFITGVALSTKEPIQSKQWLSLGGYFTIPTILFIFSKKRSKINFRIPISGLLIQSLFALFINRTDLGFTIFSFLGELAEIFLNFVEAGSSFLFGADYVRHFFAFKVLPIIIYFSSVVSILYYTGAMQWLILKIGFFVYKIMGTSATESVVACGNIFIGQTEAPLLIRPYLKHCTESELLAIMAAGMATIAGSVLGAFLDYGISPMYLITESVMSAPAVLALSKIYFPETKKSKFKNFSDMKMEKDTSLNNVIDAALNGALEAVPLVANIAAVLIAILSLMSFINGLLGYLGGLVDITDPDLTLELIFSYIFWPIAFMLGTRSEDILIVSQLIGKKIVLNEFVAYTTLAKYLEFRAAGCIRSTWISRRSEAIATYALCGFANISSMGICVAAFSSMAPKRTKTFSKLVVSALIIGALTSLLNASLAGFLKNEDQLYKVDNSGKNGNNFTDIDGFYLDCKPYCCAEQKGDEFCVLVERVECYEKCLEYQFNSECLMAEFM